MKEVLLKRHCDPKHGMKRLSILQTNEEKECTTKVYKSFRYHVTKTETMEEQVAAPEIFITKNFDTKKGIERFTFTVHGMFYIKYHREILKVNFQHTLKIQIQWQTEIFSPKKSETLT
ncbi:MAG TPA: hypothetical protein VI749_02095 [Candidatus Omnitrophota bacterium]|nr:hypothetical protein [Candidatus Omnitrophota bacterium]